MQDRPTTTDALHFSFIFQRAWTVVDGYNHKCVCVLLSYEVAPRSDSEDSEEEEEEEVG